MKQSVKVALGHQIINKDIDVRSTVVTSQANQVPVFDISQSLELSFKSSLSIFAPSFQFFHCKCSVIRQNQLVYFTIATASDYVSLLQLLSLPQHCLR